MEHWIRARNPATGDMGTYAADEQGRAILDQPNPEDTPEMDEVQPDTRPPVNSSAFRRERQ